jgi:5-formyltetrahydrofolate cyclo-ligase
MPLKIMATKKELRTKYKILRDGLTEAEVESMSLAMATHALDLPIWDADYFHLFMPIAAKKEVDTTALMPVLMGRDKSVVLPKIVEGRLKHYLLQDSTRLAVNDWGIPEPVSGIEVQPTQLEVVFVPLLAFDQSGHRVGYGKGMYDTFLGQCAPEVIKVGLSFFEAEPEFSEVYPTDIPLDFCLTPKKIYRF